MEVITLPYCDECEDFCPEACRMYLNDKLVQHVQCTHYSRCAMIEKTIMEEKKNERSDNSSY